MVQSHCFQQLHFQHQCAAVFSTKAVIDPSYDLTSTGPAVNACYPVVEFNIPPASCQEKSGCSFDGNDSKSTGVSCVFVTLHPPAVALFPNRLLSSNIFDS